MIPSHWNRIEAASATAPRPRIWHTMAFDEHRSRLILYGGTAGTDTLTDLWEWDGASRTWTDRTPQPLPAVWPARRLVAALAYDPGRRRLIMFGGFLGNTRTGGKPYGDTWEWDPQSGSWTDTTPVAGAPTPTARHSMGLVHDPARGRVFLWGGFDEAGLQPVDAWEWDGQAGTWTDVTPVPLPAAWPAGRDGHNLVYDPIDHRMLLYGGFDGDYFGDLWAWSSASAGWTSLTPTPLPRRWPVARHSAAAAYDPADERLVVFGGFNGDSRADLWEWHPDTGTWRDRTPASGSGNRTPGQRAGSVMVWDSARSKMVLFGGDGPAVEGTEIWEWDGS